MYLVKPDNVFINNFHAVIPQHIHICMFYCSRPTTKKKKNGHNMLCSNHARLLISYKLFSTVLSIMWDMRVLPYVFPLPSLTLFVIQLFGFGNLS